MKYTNKYDFPDAIVRAVTKDSYTKGDSDYSITGLIKPPQETALFRIVNKDPDAEIVVDVADQIWMLFGTAIHAILEQAHGVTNVRLLEHRDMQLKRISDIVYSSANTDEKVLMVADILQMEAPEGDPDIEKEKRLYYNIAGIKISGQPDWMALKERKIDDYKVTTVWKYMKGDYSDWEKQLNAYRYLAVVNGYDIDQLNISGIFKDWKKYELHKENYPPHPVVTVPIKMWSLIDTLDYLVSRIKLHEQARFINDTTELAEKLPCTPEERWQQPTTYALVKEGASRAYRVLNDRDEALKLLSEKPEYNFEERPGTCKKCDEFCNVADWCKQYSKPAVNVTTAVNVTKQTVVIEAPKIVIGDAPDLLDPNLLNQAIPEKAETDKIIEEEFPQLKSDVIKKEAVRVGIDSELDKLKATDTTDMKTTELTDHFDKLKQAAQTKVVEEHSDSNTIPLDTETLKPLAEEKEKPKTEKVVDPNQDFNFADLLSKVGL